MVDCKPCPTPLPVCERLSRLDGDLLDSNSNTRYRSVVGALQILLSLVLIYPSPLIKYVSIYMILQVFIGQL